MTRLTRRGLFHLFAAAMALRFGTARRPPDDSLVEVNGWILRRSDIA